MTETELLYLVAKYNVILLFLYFIYRFYMGIYNWTTIFFGREIDVKTGTTIPEDCEQLIIARKYFICVKGTKFGFDPHKQYAIARNISDLALCDLKREGYQWFSQTNYCSTYGPSGWENSTGEVKPFNFPSRETLENEKKEYEKKNLWYKYGVKNVEEIDKAIAELNNLKTLF
jgi:hypothetical protein